MASRFVCLALLCFTLLLVDSSAACTFTSANAFVNATATELAPCVWNIQYNIGGTDICGPSYIVQSWPAGFLPYSISGCLDLSSGSATSGICGPAFANITSPYKYDFKTCGSYSISYTASGVIVEEGLIGIHAGGYCVLFSVPIFVPVNASICNMTESDGSADSSSTTGAADGSANSDGGSDGGNLPGLTTPAQKAGLAAGLVGGLAAVGAVAGLAVAGGVLGYRLFKSASVPAIQGVENAVNSENDINDNKLWHDPVTTVENSAYAGGTTV
jgi:hypothetical protein